MQHAEFEATVRRLEQLAARSPRAYRWRVTSLGLLGYAYVFAVLGGLVALLVLLLMNAHHQAYVAVKAALAVGALVYLVVRALWVQLPRPEGRPLSRDEVPELFKMVDDVVAATGAPRPREILLTDEFNAAIVQRPRFGFLGGYENYLIVGLQMLQATTPDEFKAVVAHECGHLSGGHGKAGAWIYRLRAGWSRLAAALEEEAHWGRVLFLRFFRWYAPTFAAYSFVAAREQEYEADAVSARVTSAALAGRALVRSSLAGRHAAERYWPGVFSRIRQADAPPAGTHAGLAATFKQNYVAVEHDRWLADALAERTGYADTHPALADRLRALGVSAGAPPPLDQSAAERLLGRAYAGLVEELDAAWQHGVRDAWAAEHASQKEGIARHATLVAALGAATLTQEEKLELAVLEERFGDGGRAQALYETLLRARPDDADLNFHVGRLRVAADDAGGVPLLQRAATLDPQWTPAVTKVLAPYLRARGDTAALHALLDRYDAFADAAEADARGAQRLEPADRFGPADLPATVRAAVTEIAARREDVRRAWLVAKLRTDGTALLPLLVVQPYTRWWRFERAAAAQDLANELAEAVAEHGLPVFVATSQHRWLRRKLAKVTGARVYDRRARS